MAQTELEQIAIAMMMMAEDPERRRQVLQPMSTASATASVPATSGKGKNTRTKKRNTRKTVIKKEPEEISEEVEEEISNGDYEEGRNGEEGEDNNYSINPNSLGGSPSPSSPAGSLNSCGSGGGGGGANNSARRIFTPEFKQKVLNAFNSDPECKGNQRAVSRKYGIHRRQVQKWLQQVPNKGQPSSSEEQVEKAEQDQELLDREEVETETTQQKPGRSLRPQIKSTRTSIRNNKGRENQGERGKSKMPIVAGKGPAIPQASAVSSSPSANLPTSSSPLISFTKGSNSMFSHNNLLMGMTSPLLLGMENASPRISPPNHYQGTNGNGNGNGLSAGQKMLDLVDELCYLYPSEDFSLLRTAMIKNEVSFTKLSPPRCNQNSRGNSSSPDFFTQQTLQMIKNQNEYLQLLQSGYPNLSLQDVASLSDPTGKLASWIGPFAAAAGFSLPGLGKQSPENNRRKMNNSSPNGNSNHTFLTPKAPLSTSKTKTVAAVLAATRNGGGINGNGNGISKFNPSLLLDTNNKGKKPNQRRRATNGRPPKSYSPSVDDDYLDPTSMLEVVTSKPSPDSGSDSIGMDLSSASNNTPRVRNKAMNKDYGFLSELGLIPRENINHNNTNGNGGDYNYSPPNASSTANLQHFVDQVLAHHQKTSGEGSSSSSSDTPNNMPNNSTESSSDRTKESVLEAFRNDSDVAGDMRACARKFGINIRVVQKWIREAPTRSIPNGDALMTPEDLEVEDVNENYHKTLACATNGPTVNKRKNPKPNQICDFMEDREDLDLNGPLDMVVPIKKRRLSTPTSA